MSFKPLPALPPASQPFVDGSGHVTTPWREYLQRLDAELRSRNAVTVAQLPSAASVGPGFRAYVTDSNATTFNNTVAGGGSNKVPVVSDGANWKIG